MSEMNCYKFQIEKGKNQRMKILMQTRKQETMTHNNKQQLCVNQMHTSHISKILGGSFAYLELCGEMNNVTFKVLYDGIYKMQRNRTNK